MNHIGKISGIDAVFGARWDDSKGSARMKVKFSDTVGYYDDKDVSAKTYPAPAIISEMVEVDDKMAVYALFYMDDSGEIFGSTIFSGGQVAPSSETVYDTSEEWENAIIRTISDSNIDMVYYPENTVESESEKHKVYAMTAEVDEKLLPKLTSSSNLGTIAIVIVMLLILAAIPVGAWIMIAKPFEKTADEVQFVVEKIKPNFTEVLEQCAEDLEEPWPAPPEWTLQQEGCVMAPELAKIVFPKPVDQRPYAYRFYDLGSSGWDEYLSRASFLKMAERFPGQVLEGTNQFVLYLPYDITKDIVDNAYIPDTDPEAIMRRNFVGSIKMNGNSSAAGASATTDLELDRTIERLANQRLTPNHVFRNLKNQQTGMEISPERIETRQVRVQ